MATITVAQARYMGNKRGLPRVLRGGPEHPNIKETASQTYAQGAPIYYDTNGTIAVATATSNIVNPMAGFALAAASGVTGRQVRYAVLQEGDIYLMNLVGTSTTVTALGMKDNKTMFDLYTGNLLVANIDASFDDAKPWGFVEDLYTVAGGYADGDVVGDTAGRLLVRIGPGSGLQG